MGTSQRQRNTDCRFRSAIKRCSVAAPQGTYTRTQSAVSRRAPLERPAPCKILLGCPCGRKLMNKHPELATAMLAVAFCAVLLVTGHLYVEDRTTRETRATPRGDVPIGVELRRADVAGVN